MDANIADTCYISIACNSFPHCLDWGNNNLICYGACNGVAIYDPKYGGSGRVCQRLTDHTSQVTSVRWIRRPDNGAEFQFISTSVDKTAVVWNVHNGSYVFKPSYKLLGHTDVVNVAHALYLSSDKSDQETLIATGSADCTIRIWHNLTNDSKSETKCSQIINLGANFALTLTLAFHLDAAVHLLMFGGSDTKMHIYAEQNSEFVKMLSLAGHEDWIRDIDSIRENNGDLLIASSAQDCFVRIWRIRQIKDNSEQTENPIRLKGNSFSVKDRDGEAHSFNVELDAVIAGHENWVYAVNWHPAVQNSEDNTFYQPMKLLSSSMDKTMILWELDNNLGVWIEKVRVGEVGGNSLGFLGSGFSPDGMSIIAHGFQGSFHLWHFDSNSNQWEPGVVVSGHFGEVLDLDWDLNGQYVISVSSDQTTRLHAPWRRNGQQELLWYEIARPQVHGYDMTCITVIDSNKFASGADEKVLRAFQAPRNFIENFNRLCTGKITDTCDNLIPEGASVPALGLSNKAVFEKSSRIDTEACHPKDMYPEAYFVSTTLIKPPTEETLLQNTLWPEIQKMYGHGYEVYCIASNRSGTLLVSACKASKPEHAKIIVWSTSSWKEIGRLPGHTLTVTQMEFSPCEKYLLSVSRDRTWCLFEIQLTEDNEFTSSRVAYSDKKTCIHTRIIWSCSWSKDGNYFATASRDKKVIIWGKHVEDEVKNCLGEWRMVSSPLLQDDAVTAVAFAPVMINEKSYLLSVGHESGTIHLFRWNPDAAWKLCHVLDSNSFHHSSIKRLRFRPFTGCTGHNDLHSGVIQLATCGTDNCLFVINLCLKSF